MFRAGWNWDARKIEPVTTFAELRISVESRLAKMVTGTKFFAVGCFGLTGIGMREKFEPVTTFAELRISVESRLAKMVTGTKFFAVGCFGLAGIGMREKFKPVTTFAGLVPSASTSGDLRSLPTAHFDLAGRVR